MDNRGSPFLSELLIIMQLYVLFKNSTGKEKMERSFNELFAEVEMFCCWGEENVTWRIEREEN